MISKIIIHLAVSLVASYFAALCAAATINRPSTFAFPRHLVGLNESIEEELRAYQQKYRPVDLGIDLLDDDAPMFIRRAMANATLSDDPYANQLTHPNGILRLRKAIAEMYSPLVGRRLEPEDHVVVTQGATEAVYAAFTGHTSPGDEWIVIEPAYLMYVPMIKISKGVPRYTSLKLMKANGTINGDDWVLNKAEMESLFNEKTKGILLNNPLNPIGKVYKREELEFIAGLAIKYNAIVICDEAHEWITHKPHVRIASLPGMFERTITIGTSSKTFSVAGFRIGWAYGHANVLNHLKTAHEVAVYSSPAPQQVAVAYAFERELCNFGAPDSYLISHLRTVKQQRDAMIEALAGTGITPVIADGGFCMLANWSALGAKITNVYGSMQFIIWMIKNVGVLGLPLPAFYGPEHKHIGEDFVRFCFHKVGEIIRMLL
ncbi:kynurenine aminotransferase-like [Phymastichus coffea]|uniref:kynurenine aminotransferase-like n=1 Tax=Phymastichus coffea TaxID=108790 RepID=UPI00273B9AAC|nr:kynurenine aminotransferase-like [Phymastichus coffea]